MEENRENNFCVVVEKNKKNTTVEENDRKWETTAE